MIRATRGTRTARAGVIAGLALSLAACDQLVGVNFDAVSLRDDGDAGSAMPGAGGDDDADAQVGADGAPCCSAGDAAGARETSSPFDANEPRDATSGDDASGDDDAAGDDASDAPACFAINQPCAFDSDCCSQSCDPFFGCMEPADAAPPIDATPPADASGDECFTTGNVCTASDQCCSGQCLPAPFSECF